MRFHGQWNNGQIQVFFFLHDFGSIQIASRLIKNMILLLMGDMLNPTEYIGFLSEIIKIPTKNTVSGFFNHPDLELVLYANHVKKSMPEDL